jgi:hypothetical protein
VIQIKALACELPFEKNVPLSRFSTNEIVTEAANRGIITAISRSTIWRWLHEDAIKPWQYRNWIFPRDPQFEHKAERVLDLYHGIYNGAKLQSDEFVLSADEKTSIQVRRRKHETHPARQGDGMKVEFEYERCGSLAYIAAWDVHGAKIFGNCETHSGIGPFDRLVSDVMTQQPYRSAKQVFWIVDNGSAHRGQTSIDRLQTRWPNLVLVHLPVHASWLNQIEIYFSILQRKVLTPNYFSSVDDLAQTIINYQKRYEQQAKPFKWKFTKNKLKNMMANFSDKSLPMKKAA